ncbi:MAG: Cys-tRNA(Pro) deacylase [Chloroflexi bacterium]|nr:Cys-tRNA(Pro) deacylase [Chloroflexota bacterium]MDA1145966.1 Cys-tRNA(Pro) deacylase [Chloroflexota bacterium]
MAARASRSMTPGVDAARAAGIPYEIATYDHDPRAAAYGLEAAEVLGIAPGRVFKTLVAKLDGQRLATAIVPVDRQLDLKALARALGARRAEMAPPAEAERSTGYVVGGISPLGQKRRLATALDASANDHETIYVSAGRRGLEIVLAPADLATLTEAVVASIARD